GSMSGLFAALLLRRHSWHVDVFERVDAELADRGAGIVAQPSIRDAFARIGLDPAIEIGVEVSKRRVFDRDGKVIGEHTVPQTLTSWARVYRLLRGAFPAAQYHRGKTLTRVEMRADSVRAHFADGSQSEAELLVGADGLRSTVRSLLLPRS